MTVEEKSVMLDQVSDALNDYFGDLTEAIKKARNDLSDPSARQAELVEKSVGLSHISDWMIVHFPLFTGNANWADIPSGY